MRAALSNGKATLDRRFFDTEILREIGGQSAPISTKALRNLFARKEEYTGIKTSNILKACKRLREIDLVRADAAIASEELYWTLTEAGREAETYRRSLQFLSVETAHLLKVGDRLLYDQNRDGLSGLPVVVVELPLMSRWVTVDFEVPYSERPKQRKQHRLSVVWFRWPPLGCA